MKILYFFTNCNCVAYSKWNHDLKNVFCIVACAWYAGKLKIIIWSQLKTKNIKISWKIIIMKNVPKQDLNYQLIKIVHMIDLGVPVCFYNVFQERIFIWGDSIGYISQNLKIDRPMSSISSVRRSSRNPMREHSRAEITLRDISALRVNYDNKKCVKKT